MAIKNPNFRGMSLILFLGDELVFGDESPLSSLNKKNSKFFIND